MATFSQLVTTREIVQKFLLQMMQLPIQQSRKCHFQDLLIANKEILLVSPSQTPHLYEGFLSTWVFLLWFEP